MITDDQTTFPAGPTCETVQAALVALRDAELDGNAAARCTAHLQTCPACRAAQNEIAAARQITSAWPAVGGEHSADVDIWAAIRREVEQDAADQTDLRVLLDEVRRLRAEMQTLRAEIAALLRAAQSAPAAGAANAIAVPASSRLLFPYARPDDAPRPLV